MKSNISNTQIVSRRTERSVNPLLLLVHTGFSLNSDCLSVFPSVFPTVCF